MRTLSKELQQMQREGKGTYYRYADFKLKDGTTLKLTNKDLYGGGIKFEDAVSAQDSFQIGAAIINQCTITINNMYDDFTDYVFEGAEVVCYVGVQTSYRIEKIQLCTMTVTDAPYQNSSIISLTCQDNMLKFDRNYSDSKLIYPATRLQIIKDACEVCGVPMGTTSFDGDDYIVQEKPDTEELTFRQILVWTAQIGCQWARCDEYGRLCIGWYNLNPTEEESGKIMRTNGLTVNLEDVVITGIRVKEYVASETEETTVKTYLAGEEGYVLEISENQMIVEGEAENIAQMIGKRCIGMRFRPFTVSCLTDLSLEAGDPVIVTDRKGNTYKSYITVTTLQPGNYQSIACNAKSAERNSAVKYSNVTQAYVQARKEAKKEVKKYEKTVEDLTNLISQGFGMYLTGVKQEDGGTIYYMHDKPTIEESSYVCYWTSNGLIASVDGGTTWAIDKNGNALFNVITTRGLNAEWIDSGTFTAKDSKGNIVFQVNVDTGEVFIDGTKVKIGTKTIKEEIDDATKATKSLVIQLSNDNQTITVDSEGNYDTFPECVVEPMVMYGTQNVSTDCTFAVTKSDSVTGSWNSTERKYTVTALTEDSGWVEFKATYQDSVITKRFTLSKLYAGAKGEDGLRGLQGEKGEQGIPGTNGADGRTPYFHIKYSEVENPTADQMTETPSTYIGTYVDYTKEGSADPADYTWSKFEGRDGNEGIPGKNGEDGKTSYLHIAYANSEDGKTGFSTSDSTNKKYIGQYTDFEKADSTDSTKYSWSKIKGETGRIYILTASPSTVRLGADNEFSPSSLIFDAYYRDGKTDQNTYSGRFVIEESEDGKTFTEQYKSTSDTSGVHGYTIKSKKTRMIRCSLYAAGGTDTRLDFADIPVVVDADNVEVGGRNYILNSEDLSGWKAESGVTVTKNEEDDYWKIESNNHTTNHWGIYKDIAVESGTCYTSSVFCKPGTVNAEVTSGPGASLAAGDSYSKESRAVNTAGTSGTAWRIYLHISPKADGDYAYFKLPKLEKGNQATDWTAAPEDTQEKIDDAKGAADAAQAAADEAKEQINQALIDVDSIKAQIAMMVTDENGGSLMEQTPDGWTFNISAVKEQIQNAIDSAESAKGSADEAGDSVEKLKKNVDEISERTAYITVTNDGDGNPIMELGSKENEFKVQITNTAMTFYDSGEAVAYITDQCLYIQKAIVKESVQFGETQGFVLGLHGDGNFGLQVIS